MSPESATLQQAAAAFIRDRMRLGAFVGGLLRDAHAAEDVIQEVWLQLAAEVEKGTVMENQPAWGRANGTQFWLDRTNQLFGIFMVQTQLNRVPTYGTFRKLVSESANIASKGGMGGLGQAGGTGAMNSQFKQRDKNNDGKLGPDELPAALFERLDADKDGFVDAEELKAPWKR